MNTTQTLSTGSATLRKCQCSTSCTRTTRNFFAQGHDAKMVTRLTSQVTDCTGPFTQFSLDDATIEMRRAGGTEFLVGKLHRTVAAAFDGWTKQQNAAARREAKRSAKQAAKSAKQAKSGKEIVLTALRDVGADVQELDQSEELLADNTSEPQIVTAKIGRWTYQGELVDGKFTYASKLGHTKTTDKYTLV